MTLSEWSILLPMDMCGESERAVEPALRVARQEDVPLVLFSWARDAFDAASREQYLTNLASRLPGDVRVEVACTDDAGPGPAILAAAERALATVCTKLDGRAAPAHARLAVVAQEVLRHARRPVILVGGGGGSACSCPNLLSAAS